MFDIVDRMILFAQRDNQGAGGLGFRLSSGAGLALTEELEMLAAELAAQDAKGAGGVTETAGDLVRGELFDKESP